MSILGPILFNILIRKMGTECSIGLSIDVNVNHKTVKSGKDGCAASHRNLESWRNEVGRNLMKFSKGKWQTLHLLTSNPCQQYVLGPIGWRTPFN